MPGAKTAAMMPSFQSAAMRLEHAPALTAMEQDRGPGKNRLSLLQEEVSHERHPTTAISKGLNGAWTPFLAALILIATTAVALGAWQSDLQSSAAGSVTDGPRRPEFQMAE